MKILFVSTISNTINAFLISHIELLLDQGHQVDIACNIDKEISPDLIERGCEIFNVDFQRSPFTKKNFIAYKKLKKLINEKGYDIVHTHTPVASACTRVACKKLKEVKVIYTAHGFHFFKGAPLRNWLVYYPVEKMLAKYTDVLITINKEDYEIAQKSFKAKSIKYIPGVGIDTSTISAIPVDNSTNHEKFGVAENAFIVLSVGELNKNKNHSTVIRAIAKIGNPDIFYIICGAGKLENNLKDLSKELGIENQIKLLGYRNDIKEMYKSANLFAFPSFREGLSVALMEAMASGLPVVCSNIRGNRDLIVNGKGGYLVEPLDVIGFAKSIKEISMKRENTLGLNNITAIKEFDIKTVLKKMKDIYSKA